MNEYIPPSGDAVVLDFDAEYAPPQGDAVVLDLGAGVAAIRAASTTHAHTASHIGQLGLFARAASATHTHAASALGKLLSQARADSTSHPHYADVVPFTFRPHSTRHRHLATTPFRRFDFVYRDQGVPDGFATNSPVRLDFTPSVRPVGAQGLNAFAGSSSALIFNAVTSFTPYWWAGSSSFGWVRIGADTDVVLSFLQRSADSASSVPLQFDFTERDPALPVHNSTHPHKAAPCDVGVRIPLVTQSASQVQTAEHTRVVLPVRAESSQHKQHSDQVRVALPIRSVDTTHVQTAAQPALVQTSPLLNLSARHAQTVPQVWIRHTIPLTGIDHAQHEHFVQHTSVIHRPPARAHSVVHQQRATNIVVTHITPLAINKGTQVVASDQVVLRNWVGLFPADTRQVQTVSSLALYVWAALVPANTRHLHRSMRLNFLPADWIFRQVIEIEFDDRGFVLGPEERTISLEPEVREGVLPPEDRTLTIPPEIRTVELESIGRASSVER